MFNLALQPMATSRFIFNFSHARFCVRVDLAILVPHTHERTHYLSVIGSLPNIV